MAAAASTERNLLHCTAAILTSTARGSIPCIVCKPWLDDVSRCGTPAAARSGSRQSVLTQHSSTHSHLRKQHNRVHHRTRGACLMARQRRLYLIQRPASGAVPAVRECASSTACVWPSTAGNAAGCCTAELAGPCYTQHFWAQASSWHQLTSVVVARVQGWAVHAAAVQASSGPSQVAACSGPAQTHRPCLQALPCLRLLPCGCTSTSWCSIHDFNNSAFGCPQITQSTTDLISSLLDVTTNLT